MPDFSMALHILGDFFGMDFLRLGLLVGDNRFPILVAFVILVTPLVSLELLEPLKPVCFLLVCFFGVFLLFGL